MKLGFRSALLLVVSGALLSACGGGSEQPQAERRVAGPLPDEAQVARFKACMDRLAYYRELGVVKHGGAQPGVDRAAWDTLKPAEKAEMFDVAACISSGGAVIEKIVTIAEQGGGVDIETRRVANDRDFAGEAQGKK